MQRAYDNIIHDVAIQKLHVIFVWIERDWLEKTDLRITACSTWLTKTDTQFDYCITS